MHNLQHDMTMRTIINLRRMLFVSGDFDVRLDRDTRHAEQLLSVFEAFGLQICHTGATHRDGGVLDLVAVPATMFLCPSSTMSAQITRGCIGRRWFLINRLFRLLLFMPVRGVDLTWTCFVRGSCLWSTVCSDVDAVPAMVSGFLLLARQFCRRSLMENWRTCPGFVSGTVLRDVNKDC